MRQRIRSTAATKSETLTEPTTLGYLLTFSRLGVPTPRQQRRVRKRHLKKKRPARRLRKQQPSLDQHDGCDPNRWVVRRRRRNCHEMLALQIPRVRPAPLALAEEKTASKRLSRPNATAGCRGWPDLPHRRDGGARRGGSRALVPLAIVLLPMSMPGRVRFT